jgi:hypothetical protein
MKENISKNLEDRQVPEALAGSYDMSAVYWLAHMV